MIAIFEIYLTANAFNPWFLLLFFKYTCPAKAFNDIIEIMLKKNWSPRIKSFAVLKYINDIYDKHYPHQKASLEWVIYMYQIFLWNIQASKRQKLLVLFNTSSTIQPEVPPNPPPPLRTNSRLDLNIWESLKLDNLDGF